MIRPIKICLVATAIAVASHFASGPAKAGDGWGWAKPLNKKVGSAFYTSNRHINNSYGARSRAWRRANVHAPQVHKSLHQIRPIYKTPIHPLQVPIHRRAITTFPYSKTLVPAGTGVPVFGRQLRYKHH